MCIRVFIFLTFWLVSLVHFSAFASKCCGIHQCGIVKLVQDKRNEKQEFATGRIQLITGGIWVFIGGSKNKCFRITTD